MSAKAHKKLRQELRAFNERRKTEPDEALLLEAKRIRGELAARDIRRAHAVLARKLARP